MQMVFQVLGALAATVAIVDAKDLQFWPLVTGHPRFFRGGLDHIKNDRNSVFVGLTDYTYVCVCREGLDGAKCFSTNLARLEEGERALRLVLLQQFRHGRFDTLRSQLCLSTRPFALPFWLLRQSKSFHDDAESGSLPDVLHEARS